MGRDWREGVSEWFAIYSVGLLAWGLLWKVIVENWAIGALLFWRCLGR